MKYDSDMTNDAEVQVGVVSEPAASYAVKGYPDNDSAIEEEYDFLDKDFGYARTLEELNTALEEAEAERNDPTKWITSEEFHERVESKYPWLR